MLTREELIDAINALPTDATLSVLDVSELLRTNINTVRGWLSNERDYPVATRGGRKKKHYSKPVVTKLALFVYATKGTGGVSINGLHAITTLNNIESDRAFAVLSQGHAQFLALFNGTP